MRRLLFPSVLTGLLVLFCCAGCDSLGGEDTGGVVTLVGQVLNDQTNNPVPGAFVRINPYNLLLETDEEGRYAADVDIDSTMQLHLTATKDGFGSASTPVLALAGRVIDVPTLRLSQVAEEKPSSGRASNILLLKQSAQSIGVKESGSEEVAKITFQVADSLGRPVILDNAAQVNFTFGANPGGGAFIFPTSARTDNNGQVTVNLSSGTRAGVVQIVAEATVEGRTIRSLPVSVAIHGGLPQQQHFTVAPVKRNFPGLRFYNIENEIAVIVGDKYGNPVKPGTAVYFTSTHGVIGGSTLTDAAGRGGVRLLSANPLPADGIALVTATTADENRQQIGDATGIVFSGAPVVGISPSVAALNQSYRLTVMDPNGNPLAPGTQVSIQVEGTKVKAVGHTDVELDDTAFIGGWGYDNVVRGHGITEFSFSAVEDLTLDEAGEPDVRSVTVSVSGPNGKLELVLLSDGSPAQIRTDGATVEHRIDGTTVVHAPQQ